MTEKTSKNGNGTANESGNNGNAKKNGGVKVTVKKNKPDKKPDLSEPEKPVDDAGDNSDNPESGQPDSENSSTESDPTPADDTVNRSMLSDLTMDSTSIIEISRMDNADYSEKIIAETKSFYNPEKLKQLRKEIPSNDDSKNK